MDEEQANAVEVVEEQPSLTAEDVEHAVENALSTRDAHDVVIEDMSHTLVEIRDGVALLGSNAETDEEQTSADDVTYMVRLDSSQVEVAKSAARLVCTEGLFVIILLATLCGLTLWQILQSRWSRG